MHQQYSSSVKTKNEDKYNIWLSSNYWKTELLWGSFSKETAIKKLLLPVNISGSYYQRIIQKHTTTAENL